MKGEGSSSQGAELANAGLNLHILYTLETRSAEEDEQDRTKRVRD